jgi:uncharacterized membrane protein YfcA
VGGGIVIVPVLYSILPLLHAPENARMHIAVATSLASVRAHYRNGGIDVAIVRRLAPTLFLGAALGAALGGKISSDILAGWLVCLIGFAGGNKNRFCPRRYGSLQHLPAR